MHICSCWVLCPDTYRGGHTIKYFSPFDIAIIIDQVGSLKAADTIPYEGPAAASAQVAKDSKQTIITNKLLGCDCCDNFLEKDFAFIQTSGNPEPYPVTTVSKDEVSSMIRLMIRSTIRSSLESEHPNSRS